MILFAFLISFSIGLLFRYHVAACAIASIIYLIFIYKRTNKYVFCISILLIAIGVGISFINIVHAAQSEYKGIVSEVSDNYFIFISRGERFYIYSKGHPYEIGDVLYIKGIKTNLNFTTLESSFDFKDYLLKKGVLSALEPHSIKSEFLTPIRLKSGREAFLSHFDKESASLIKMILFSKGGSSETADKIKAFHLSRFLSTSGIYFHFFLNTVTFLFNIRIKKKWSQLISLGLLFPYALFVYPKFSVIKIMTLSLLTWINKYILKERFHYFTVLSFSGFLFLIINYRLIYSDSFILAYSIPILFYYIRNLLSQHKKIIRKVMSPIFVAIFFIPFEMKYFSSICLLSYPFSILFTPIFIFFAFVSLLCFYKIPLFGVVSKTTRWISYIFNKVKPLSISVNCPSFPDIMFLIFIFIYLAILYYFSIGFKPIYKVLLTIEMMIMIINILPIKNTFTTQVSFINVGQGDSCLVRYKNTTVLIDTGGSLYSDIANDSLIPYFKKNRLFNIDYVITTHNDYDHMGALKELENNFNIKNHISSPESFPFYIKGIEFNNYNNHISSDNDDNENSLVIGFTLSNISYLITGDAPISIEKKIMEEYVNIPCDVLKIGHHGSNTSTSDAFIKYLSPKDAVISVGKNYYGHPNQSVIDILNKNKVNIKRTDILGTIIYSNYIFM